MKKTFFIALAACITLTGCYFNRGVDETIETERFTMRMVSWDMDVDNVIKHGKAVRDFKGPDTVVQRGTVPELAYLLAYSSDSINSTTLYWYDNKKQNFLPGYTYLIVDRDTAQPLDYTPLLHAMMKKGLLRADTTYETMRILEIFDRARYEAPVDTIETFVISDDGDTHYGIEINTISAFSIVMRMRERYRMPVNLAPGVDPYSQTEERWSNGDWKADSLWLDSRGMRIVPDPQGRQMRVIEFNRCKGKI